MEIPVSIAQKIVSKLRDIISRNINFKNKRGVIIASTDENRIGNFHESALKVIESKKQLIISKEEEDKEKDIREGINIPIKIDEEVVGVIGVTGVATEVQQYADIIKSMTEILIKEAFIYQQKYLEEQNYKLLIEDVIFNVMDNDFETVKDRAKFMGIDYTLMRTVIQIEVNEKSILSISTLNDIENILKKNLQNNKQHILVPNGVSFLILFNGEYDYKMEEFLDNISRDFNNQLNLEYNLGIGLTVSNLNEIRKSYQTSTIALQIAIKSKDRSRVAYFRDLDTELLIEDISYNIKTIYINKIFNKLSNEKIDEYKELIETYIKNNGSINKIATELYIHKNTVQYKLNKIEKETGYNPRNYSDLIKLAIACNIYDNK